MAACAIIDDVRQAAKEEDDNFDQAGNVRISAMTAKTAYKRGKIERKTRPPVLRASVMPQTPTE